MEINKSIRNIWIIIIAVLFMMQGAMLAGLNSIDARLKRLENLHIITQ